VVGYCAEFVVSLCVKTVGLAYAQTNQHTDFCTLYAAEKFIISSCCFCRWRIAWLYAVSFNKYKVVI